MQVWVPQYEKAMKLSESIQRRATESKGIAWNHIGGGLRAGYGKVLQQRVVGVEQAARKAGT